MEVGTGKDTFVASYVARRKHWHDDQSAKNSWDFLHWISIWLSDADFVTRLSSATESTIVSLPQDLNALKTLVIKNDGCPLVDSQQLRELLVCFVSLARNGRKLVEGCPQANVFSVESRSLSRSLTQIPCRAFWRRAYLWAIDRLLEMVSVDGSHEDSTQIHLGAAVARGMVQEVLPHVSNKEFAEVTTRCSAALAWQQLLMCKSSSPDCNGNSGTGNYRDKVAHKTDLINLLERLLSPPDFFEIICTLSGHTRCTRCGVSQVWSQVSLGVWKKEILALEPLGLTQPHQPIDDDPMTSLERIGPYLHFDEMLSGVSAQLAISLQARPSTPLHKVARLHPATRVCFRPRMEAATAPPTTGSSSDHVSEIFLARCRGRLTHALCRMIQSAMLGYYSNDGSKTSNGGIQFMIRALQGICQHSTHFSGRVLPPAGSGSIKIRLTDVLDHCTELLQSTLNGAPVISLSDANLRLPQSTQLWLAAMANSFHIVCIIDALVLTLGPHAHGRSSSDCENSDGTPPCAIAADGLRWYAWLQAPNFGREQVRNVTATLKLIQVAFEALSPAVLNISKDGTQFLRKVAEIGDQTHRLLAARGATIVCACSFFLLRRSPSARKMDDDAIRIVALQIVNILLNAIVSATDTHRDSKVGEIWSLLDYIQFCSRVEIICDAHPSALELPPDAWEDLQQACSSNLRRFESCL